MGENKSGKPITYRDAGVDIDAGNRAVDLIREQVRATWRPEVLTDIGTFGGMFALAAGKYREPVLVSGTDGVGTKLRIAQMLGRHNTIGIDCVAMCVNDILVHGAEPLFFLDYLAVGKMIPERVAEIVSGVAEGCRQAGCALIGGETAEMPGFYGEEEYDLAGFVVGVAEKSEIITGQAIKKGDKVLGLASAGLHSNGYSLARRVLLEQAGLKLEEYVPSLGCTLGEELLRPTLIYAQPVKDLLGKFRVRGMAHITGGGLVENIPRILPSGLAVRLEAERWEIPPVFRLIEESGPVSREEMFRTFNMGLGMVAVLSPHEAEEALAFLQGKGVKACLAGEVVAGNREVEIVF